MSVGGNDFEGSFARWCIGGAGLQQIYDSPPWYSARYEAGKELRLLSKDILNQKLEEWLNGLSELYAEKLATLTIYYLPERSRCSASSRFSRFYT